MAEQSDVCNFFRKPSKNRANIRKRKTPSDSGEDGESDPENPQLKPNKRTLASTKPNNKLIFSSKHSSSSKPETEPESDKLFHFESSNEIQTHHDSRATASLETETDFSRDARAIRERVLKQAEEALKGKTKSGSDKLYKGIHGYTDYKAGFRREQTVAGEKAGGAHGPLRPRPI